MEYRDFMLSVDNLWKKIRDRQIPIVLRRYNDSFIAFLETKANNKLLTVPERSNNNYAIRPSEEQLKADRSHMDFIHHTFARRGLITKFYGPAFEGSSLHYYVAQSTVAATVSGPRLTLHQAMLRHYEQYPHHSDWGDWLMEVPVKEIVNNDVKTIKCLTIKDNKYVIEPIPVSEIKKTAEIHVGSESGLLVLSKHISVVKIKSFEESADIFGYRQLKKIMCESESYFTIKNIEGKHICKKDGVARFIVEVERNNRNYKFLASDMEFFLPPIDILLKGYIKPKDKRIKNNSTVKVINDKGIRIPKNSVALVTSLVKTSSNVKYANVAFNNKNYIINLKQLKIV